MTNAYIAPATLARIDRLPKNRRIGEVAEKPAAPTEMEVWQDGFGVGLFFGGLLVDAILLGLHYLNG